MLLNLLGGYLVRVLSQKHKYSDKQFNIEMIQINIGL